MRIKDCTEVSASQVVGLWASASWGLALGWGLWSSGGHTCFQVSSVWRAACPACSLKGKQEAAFAGEGGFPGGLPGRAEGAGASPGGPFRTCVRCGWDALRGAEGRAGGVQEWGARGWAQGWELGGRPAGKGSPAAPRGSPARRRALPSPGADGGCARNVGFGLRRTPQRGGQVPRPRPRDAPPPHRAAGGSTGRWVTA